MTEAEYILTEEQAVDAYDDLMIRIAISGYMKLHGQKVAEDNERLRQDPQYRLTPESAKRFERTVNRAFRKKAASLALKGVYRVVNKAAMVVLAAVTMFGATMFASAEFRNTIYKLILTQEEKYTLIELDSRTNLEFVGNEAYTWEHAFAPTVMPFGYAASEVFNSSNLHLVIYTRDDGTSIKFFQDNAEAKATMQIDTEGAQLIQSVFIGDSNGMLVSKNGLNTLVWRIGNNLLRLVSAEDSSVLMTIANGIMLLK